MTQHRSRRKDPKNTLVKSVMAELKPSKDYPVWVIIIEQKQIQDNFKMIQFDVYDNGRLEYQASIVTKMNENEYASWQLKPEGTSEISVLTLSGRGKNIFEKGKEFLSRTFEEGKLQDFLPFKGLFG